MLAKRIRGGLRALCFEAEENDETDDDEADGKWREWAPAPSQLRASCASATERTEVVTGSSWTEDEVFIVGEKKEMKNKERDEGCFAAGECEIA